VIVAARAVQKPGGVEIAGTRTRRGGPDRQDNRALGFVPVGVYREQGWLDGRWVDVVVMEQVL
jgi:L-amino acid N-acyltransferase YncA